MNIRRERLLNLPQTFNIKRTSFVDLSSENDGGAILLFFGLGLYLDQVGIYNCHGKRWGGGICAENIDEISFKRVCFLDCSCPHTVNGVGGNAFKVRTPLFEFSDSLLLRCGPNETGHSDSSFHIFGAKTTGNLINNTYCQGFDGSICGEYQSAKPGSLMAKCMVTWGRDYCLMAFWTTTMTIEDSIFHDNQNYLGQFYWTSKPIIRRCGFWRNDYTTDNQVGISYDDGCYFEENFPWDTKSLIMVNQCYLTVEPKKKLFSMPILAALMMTKY